MSEDELERAAKKYNRKYNKWTGVLQHIAVWSRQDISHAVMRLSGYNAAPSLPCWKALDHTMRYLYHKPHVPIMYPRKKVEENKIVAHHAKGEGEITDLKNIRAHTGLKMYTDADLAKDMTTRRSVISVVHEYNEVAFAWKIVKQAGVALHTNGSEIRAFFKGVKRTKTLRRFFESLGRIIKGPTPSYEDNDATIHQIQANKLTPKIKHLDIMMTWLHEQDAYKIFVTIYCRTDLNKSDMNTKAHGRVDITNKTLMLNWI